MWLKRGLMFPTDERSSIKSFSSRKKIDGDAGAEKRGTNLKKKKKQFLKKQRIKNSFYKY